MSQTIQIQPGDMYCPICLEPIDEWAIEDGRAALTCRRNHLINQPFTVEGGRFEWDWDEPHPKPNPGCPMCGTCNIRFGYPWLDDNLEESPHFQWWCKREVCRARWLGTFRKFENGSMRWTIRLRAEQVPYERY